MARALINLASRRNINAINHAFSLGYDSLYALKLAAEEGNDVAVGILVAQDTQSSESTIFINAAKDSNRSHYENNSTAVRCLLAVTGITLDAKNKALIEASYAGNDLIVAQLLCVNGIDVNYTHNDTKNSALILAAKQGHDLVVQYLLNARGILVNNKDKRYKTALMHAAENGHGAVVQLLESYQNTRLDSTDGENDPNNCDTALMLAAKKKHSHVLIILLNSLKSIGLHSIGRDSATAMGLVDFAAIINGQIVLEHFWRQGAKLATNIKSSLLRLSSRCWGNIVAASSELMSFSFKKSLLELFRNLAPTQELAIQAIYSFARHGNLKAIKHSTKEDGYKLEEKDIKGLAIDENISIEERITGVKTLLKTEGYSAYGPKVLEDAVKNGTAELVEIMVKAEVKVTPEILMCAVKIGGSQSIDEIYKSHVEAVKAMLQSDVDVTSKILMEAVITRRIELVQAILESKPDAKEQDNILGLFDRKTPLILAARNGDIEIVRALVKSGAKIEEISSGGYGFTALSIAVRENKLNVVEYLVEEIIENKKGIEDAGVFFEKAISALWGKRIKARVGEKFPSYFKNTASYKLLLSAKDMVKNGKVLDSGGLIWAADNSRNNNNAELVSLLNRKLGAVLGPETALAPSSESTSSSSEESSYDATSFDLEALRGSSGGSMSSLSDSIESDEELQSVESPRIIMCASAEFSSNESNSIGTGASTMSSPGIRSEAYRMVGLALENQQEDSNSDTDSLSTISM